MATPSTPQVFTESGLQAACHTWFHNHHPKLRGLGFIIHNDGAKHTIQAAQDKARGLVPGIPDWCLMVPSGVTHHQVGVGTAAVYDHLALFVEFKVGRNGVDPLQAKRIAQLQGQGYRVEVVRDLPTFQQLLTDYLSAA